MTQKRIRRQGSRHVKRRLLQGLVILLLIGLPWIDGFRIEISSARFWIIGYAFPLAMPYSLILILGFLGAVWGITLISYFKGRVFCGWVCPYGSLMELSEGLRKAFDAGANSRVVAVMSQSKFHRAITRAAAVFSLITIPGILAFSFASYVVSPLHLLLFLKIPSNGTAALALWLWIGMIYSFSLLLIFLVRFHVCRMICIYGMAQALVASSADPDRVMRPRFLPAGPDACGPCKACLKSCYVDLDPRVADLRLGFGSGCFNCGECIDICTLVQEHAHRPAHLTFASPMGLDNSPSHHPDQQSRPDS